MSLSSTPCSNHALYIGKDNKIYDSLLIFNDIVHQNISFYRENLYFILVYNESKNGYEECEAKQEDNPKTRISKYSGGYRGNRMEIKLGNNLR